MVSRRNISDYTTRYLPIKDAVYLVYPISGSEVAEKGKRKKRKKPIQEEVIYDTKKLDWVARVNYDTKKLDKADDKYMNMDELRKLGYNISYMVFPIPISRFSKDRTSNVKYDRIINDKSAFFNLRNGIWTDMRHNFLVPALQNKLYEFLSEVVKENVSESLKNENREKIAKFIVKSMAKLHTHIEDLEEIIEEVTIS